MEIENKTPFIFETLPFAAARDKFRLIIMLKASFQYDKNGSVSPLEQQLPLIYADEPDPEAQSLAAKLEADTAPYKVNGDILIDGQAYSSNGKKVPFLDVAVQVGPVQHALNVIGDRVWTKGGMFGGLGRSRPEPFTEMALSYGRAYGGQDPESGEVSPLNPVGKGFLSDNAKKNAEGVALPNIEDPNRLITEWNDRPPPVGLTPLCKSWAPRMNLAGDFSDPWQEQRAPAMPEDFKSLFYNAAPPELQVPGYLKGGEKVLLKNLSPQGKDFFTIPVLQPQINIVKGNVKKSVHPAFDTLLCKPADKTFACVWRCRVDIADMAASDVELVALNLDMSAWEKS